jgi:thymidylate synthase (FAD)
MTEYTVVEPHVVFMEPPNQETYLQFLETCTRVCYKSEEHIKLGSAEKLMGKVVKEYEHFSVTEHANAVFRVNGTSLQLNEAFQELSMTNKLLRRDKYYTPNGAAMLVSGNVRMWMDYLKYQDFPSPLKLGMLKALHKKWPFFFDEYPESPNETMEVEILDENPMTNKNNLSTCMMKRHMTMTFKFVGDRTMSHQLVRHRLFAFSQESQRYCNYGKKGFQFVVPPSADDTVTETGATKRNLFIAHATHAYGHYLHMLQLGLKAEDARGVLPNCTKTEVVTTGTLGYWVDHIFPHRGHNKKAQWQIRMLALQAEEIMQEKVPVLWK